MSNSQHSDKLPNLFEPTQLSNGFFDYFGSVLICWFLIALITTPFFGLSPNSWQFGAFALIGIGLVFIFSTILLIDSIRVKQPSRTAAFLCFSIAWLAFFIAALGRMDIIVSNHLQFHAVFTAIIAELACCLFLFLDFYLKAKRQNSPASR